MRPILPLQKNQTIKLKIENINSDGNGVGRYEGFAVFVPLSMPGETVEAAVIKIGKNYAVAKLLEVIDPSGDRIETKCPVFSRCGGCSYQNMRYEAQLTHKQKQVMDALARIGGLSGFNISNIVPSEPYGYRNKAAFPFGVAKGELVCGPYRRQSHQIIDTCECNILKDDIMKAIGIVKEWARLYKLMPYDETTGRGLLRHVVVRRSNSGQISVMVVAAKKQALPFFPELDERLKRGLQMTYFGLAVNYNTKDTNVILGDETKVAYGGKYVVERYNGIDYSVSYDAFLQVNSQIAQKLYEKVLEYSGVTPEDNVLDIYCGIGTMTLMMARYAKSVIGIECVKNAVYDARLAATKNGLEARFEIGLAEDIVPNIIKEGFLPDIAVLDPPRKGCERSLLDCLAKSGVKRIIYVSCNPATLARDCKELGAFGYNVVEVQPYDMFPQTSHVETVVLLVKTDI